MKEFICILCPRGCHLQVEDKAPFSVSGNFCNKGIFYGREEATAPKRVVTSTVRIENSMYPSCPVKTNGRIPKELQEKAVALLRQVSVVAPIQEGDVVFSDIFDTGVDFVATKNMR